MFEWSEEQLMIRQTVRDLARERIAPRAAEIDETAEFPWDVVELFRSHDLFALPFTELLFRAQAKRFTFP